MSAPGYQPPQPPVGAHPAQVSGVDPDALARLSGEVRRLRVLVGVSTVASVVALALGGLALVGRSADAVPGVAATRAAPAASGTPVTRPRPADAGVAPAGTIVLGPTDQGLPVLDIYEDFQCPACAQAEEHFGAEVDQLVASGRVEVRFHVMTFLDAMLRNDSSARASAGGFCAHEQGRFLAWHDTLFANHPATEGTGWTDAQLAGHAGTSGLDTAAWQACVDSGKYATAVQQANEGSLAGGVNSTPTYKLNGATLDLGAVAGAGGLAVVIDSVR